MQIITCNDLLHSRIYGDVVSWTSRYQVPNTHHYRKNIEQTLEILLHNCNMVFVELRKTIEEKLQMKRNFDS